MKVLVLLMNLFFLVGVSYGLWNRSGAFRSLFWPTLLFKLLCGIALGLIYYHHYKVGDTITYYEDGVLLADIARDDPGNYFRILFSERGEHKGWPELKFEEPRAVILVKAVSLFNFITLNNYWVTSLYFSLFSFLGAWYLVKCLHRYLPGTTPAAVIAFLILPSAVFWSSGVIKESLVMASLFFLAGIFLQAWFSEKITIAHWLIVPVAIWLLWNLKYYFAGIFFMILITNFLFRFVYQHFLKPVNYKKEIAVWLVLLIIPLALTCFLHPNFYPSRLLSVVVENHKAFAEISEPEDLIQFSNLQPNPISILINAPWAMTSGLFRPFFWEAHNWLQIIASLENLLLLVLSSIGVYCFRAVSKSGHRILVLSVLAYTALLCIFITLSTPNFGTLSRYRVSYIPFLFYILCCSQPVLTILQRSFNRLVRIER